MSSVQLAEELGTTQRTINRWKASPEFQAEIRRVHELMAIQSTAVSDGGGRASPRPRARPRSPRPDTVLLERSAALEQEHREVEAMIAQILDQRG